MDKWQYDVKPFPAGKYSQSISTVLLDELNKDGEKGWEVIGIINYPDPKQFFLQAETSFFVLLKRRVS